MVVVIYMIYKIYEVDMRLWCLLAGVEGQLTLVLYSAFGIHGAVSWLLQMKPLCLLVQTNLVVLRASYDWFSRDRVFFLLYSVCCFISWSEATILKWFVSEKWTCLFLLSHTWHTQYPKKNPLVGLLEKASLFVGIVPYGCLSLLKSMEFWNKSDETLGLSGWQIHDVSFFIM